MTFGATVVDHKSELIRDLTPGDCEVLEDGKSQTLRFYAAGDGAAAPVLHLGLLLDASGSMVSDMKLAQSAANKVLNLLPKSQDITLVDFDTRVRITRYPQRDFPRLVRAFGSASLTAGPHSTMLSAPTSTASTRMRAVASW